MTSHPTPGVQNENVPEGLNRGTQDITREMALKAFVRTTRPSFYALQVVLKQYTREITSITGSSSHEALNWPGTFRRNHTTATTTVG